MGLKALREFRAALARRANKVSKGLPAHRENRVSKALKGRRVTLGLRV